MTDIVRSCVRVLGFALAAFLLAGVPTGPATDAGAATGSAGPIEFSVSQSSRLPGSQSVTIHAQAPDGLAIYELRAKLCAAGYRGVTNTYDFGPQGRRCSNVPLPGGDAETAVSFGEGGSASGDLGFTIGSGQVVWVNDLGYDNTLTCGPGAACLLVVQAQISDATVFYNAPLCYGAECPVEPGQPELLPPPVAETTPPPAASAEAQPATPVAEPTKAKATPGKIEAKNGGVGGGTSSSARAAELASQQLDDAQAASTMSVSTGLLSQRERVFLAAVVGALGAAHVVHVMSRVRRRTPVSGAA